MFKEFGLNIHGEYFNIKFQKIFIETIGKLLHELKLSEKILQNFQE